MPPCVPCGSSHRVHCSGGESHEAIQEACFLAYCGSWGWDTIVASFMLQAVVWHRPFCSFCWRRPFWWCSSPAFSSWRTWLFQCLGCTWKSIASRILHSCESLCDWFWPGFQMVGESCLQQLLLRWSLTGTVWGDLRTLWIGATPFRQPAFSISTWRQFVFEWWWSRWWELCFSRCSWWSGLLHGIWPQECGPAIRCLLINWSAQSFSSNVHISSATTTVSWSPASAWNRRTASPTAYLVFVFLWCPILDPVSFSGLEETQHTLGSGYSWCLAWSLAWWQYAYTPSGLSRPTWPTKCTRACCFGRFACCARSPTFTW